MSKPFVKWAGGKEGELKYILPSLPEKIRYYVEPFVGGGALFFALSDNKSIKKRYINDFSDELFNLYIVIKNSFGAFEEEIKLIMHNWDILKKIAQNNRETFLNFYNQYVLEENAIGLDDNVTSFILSHSDEFNGMLRAGDNAQIRNLQNEIRKYIIRRIKRIKKLEESGPKFSNDNIIENVETALKASYYIHIRNLYNDKSEEQLSSFFTKEKEVAYFYFLREYCYSSMFRYNKKGKFNVPYGGIAYNTKNILTKVNNIKKEEISDYLKKTTIANEDFETFLKTIELDKDDFVFLDPPYDSEFSEYAKNSFSKKDQARLAKWAASTKAKVMIVIKNTDFIFKLYSELGFKILSFDKKYMVNFNNRNDRKVKHLLITNY